MHVWGVCGGSGSGKTYLTSQIVEHFGPRCAVIAFDAYYKDLTHLSFADRCDVNFDHPDSLDGALLAGHLRQLRAGSPVDVPVYDFAQHLRTSEVRPVEPCELIVVEGILLLALPTIREQLTMSIYLDVPEQVRLERRVARDVAERGRDEATVRENFASVVAPMHDQFVRPNRLGADVVVRPTSDRQALLETLFTFVDAPRDAR